MDRLAKVGEYWKWQDGDNYTIDLIISIDGDGIATTKVVESNCHIQHEEVEEFTLGGDDGDWTYSTAHNTPLYKILNPREDK